MEKKREQMLPFLRLVKVGGATLFHRSSFFSWRMVVVSSM